MADSRWGIIGAVIAAVVMAGCGGLSPDMWWTIHTQCPVVTHASLDWSPDGTQIVYSADPVSHRYRVIDVFVLDVDNPSHIQQLTHTGNADAPKWSPDGKSILYVDIVGDTISNALMNSDGTSKQRISVAGPLAWSPDGKMVATSILRDPSQGINSISDIAIVQLSDMTTQIVEGAIGTNPDWSPDGKQLVFELEGHLYMVDTDGNNLKQLTSTGIYSNPKWSPDGKSILFLTFDRASRDHGISILDLTTNTIAAIATSSDITPSWSPDSKRIAFISVGWAENDIYIINADGTNLTQLTHNPTGGICPH